MENAFLSSRPVPGSVVFPKLDGENNLEFQMVRILSKPRYWNVVFLSVLCVTR